MNTHLDLSLYPDEEPPEELVTESQQVEHLRRVIGAFDHGLVPEESTLNLLVSWKKLFDRYPMSASPAYHALRSLFGWEQVVRAPFFGEPTYCKFDRIERRTDGFEDAI